MFREGALSVLASVAAALTATPASADPTARASAAPEVGPGSHEDSEWRLAKATGFELQALTGFGVPLGSSAGGGYPGAPSSPLNNDITNMVPFGVDAGYRFTPRFYAGAYFTYAVGSLPSGVAQSCASPVAGCSLRDLRLGIDVQVHALPMQRLDPWIGLGAGYEWLDAHWNDGFVSWPGFGALHGSDHGGDIGGELRGWEFAAIQAGLDYRLAAQWAVSPVLMLSVAEFDTYSQYFPSTQYAPSSSRTSSVGDKSLHAWLLLGVRGVFDPQWRAAQTRGDDSHWID